MRNSRGAAALAALACGAPALGDPTTTIITHGLSIGSKGAWVQSMAEAVRQSGAGAGSIYRYDGATGAWRYLPSISDGTTNDVVLIFNWADESDAVATGPNWDYADGAADALYTSLADPRYLDGAGPASLVNGRAIHLIGHSRGATVISEAARRLVLAGVTVDHLTALDPHPVNGAFPSCLGVGGDWSDSTPARWRREDGCAEVTFADDYYRTDNNACDPSGMPLASFLTVSLQAELGDNDGFDNDLFGSCPLEHTKVHSWYHGTVDVGAADDGDGCAIANAWYDGPGGACTTRICQGYYFSHLGGGASERPALAPAEPAGSAPILFNGEFAQGSYAGWAYHGGGGANAVDAGVYLTLRSGFTTRTHNRFFLPAAADTLEYDYRIPTASPDDELVVTLTEVATGMSVEVDRLDLNTVVPGFTVRMVPLPADAPLGKACRLTLALDFGGAAEATVHVDNVEITGAAPGCAPCPGDLNGDQVVDTADLGLLLAAFGDAGAGLAADLNGDLVVDTADLGVLLAVFGVPCEPVS